jgi:hypothetical protein
LHGELFPGEGEKVPGDLICCLAEKWRVPRKRDRKDYTEDPQRTQWRTRLRHWIEGPPLKTKGGAPQALGL